MTASRVYAPKLHVVSAPNEHYIRVPNSRCDALLTYLRGSGLQVSRPEPCTADTQTVSLVGTVDAVAVQKLLSRWE
jgi:hypothetical protein